MNDKINITGLDSLQADLLVHILQEYRIGLYEHRQDECTGRLSPRVMEQLNFIDGLCYHLKSEINRIYYQGGEFECVGRDAGDHLIFQRK